MSGRVGFPRGFGRRPHKKRGASSDCAIDTGLFGIPAEAYGFSRDARGTFGPPAFADGVFDFPATGGMREALRLAS